MCRHARLQAQTKNRKVCAMKKSAEWKVTNNAVARVSPGLDRRVLFTPSRVNSSLFMVPNPLISRVCTSSPVNQFLFQALVIAIESHPSPFLSASSMPSPVHHFISSAVARISSKTPAISPISLHFTLPIPPNRTPSQSTFSSQVPDFFASLSQTVSLPLEPAFLVSPWTIIPAARCKQGRQKKR